MRTRDHQRVLEWIELTGTETDRDLDKFEARMLRAFAGELVQSVIKVLKRRSYGIKNLGNFFRRIWLELRGHEAFAH